MRSVWVTPSASRNGRERKNSSLRRRASPRSAISSARGGASGRSPEEVRGRGAELVGEHGPDLEVEALAAALVVVRAAFPRAASRGSSTVRFAASLKAGISP